MDKEENLRDSYLLAFFSGLVFFIGQMCRHNAFYEAPLAQLRVRGSLLGLLYKKLSQMSQYTINNQELGKITNLLSNDFNLIEYKAPIFFAGSVMPLVLIGVVVILVVKFGWPGIIPPVVVGILVPIQILIGKKMSDSLKKVNIYKDQRVKVCT